MSTLAGMRRGLILVLVAVLLSCGSTKPGPARANRLVAPLLDESTLNPVGRRGYTLFQKDLAALRATDAATEDALGDLNVSGWITTRRADLWRVRFVGDDEAVRLDIDVDVMSEFAPSVYQHVPPVPLEAAELAMWRARQKAIEHGFRACSDRYNTVVLEEEYAGEPVWAVYLLAATIEPNVVMLGGHHRTYVTRDGSRVLMSEQLTLSCIRSKIEDKDEFVMVSHSLHPRPIETHYYLSLVHPLSLGVVIVHPEREGDTWIIDAGKARLIREAE